MHTEKPGISLPLDAIRASLDAAAADPVRHSAQAVSTHFDRLRDRAEKTPAEHVLQ